jgi:hypothetical protein
VNAIAIAVSITGAAADAMKDTKVADEKKISRHRMVAA